MTTLKLIKIQDAQPTGEYKPTTLDQIKKDADFLLIQVNPYYIRWKDGKLEKVNKRKLNKLQKQYAWYTDF